jgi:hypothetical protein
VSLPLPLEDAVRSLKLDPSHPVRVKVDDELTVEVRAVTAKSGPEKTVGELLDEIGRWEGETGEELDALFANIRQRSNRRVPDLP